MKRRAFCASAFALASAAAFTRNRVLAAASLSGEVPIVRLDGKQGSLAGSDVKDFRASLRGELLMPGDRDYDVARTLWNADIDRHPALIARCAGAADVSRAVSFARAHELTLAVRGGGHSFSGQSVCEGGLMIDLSRMRSIRVDPVARTARVDPGVLLGELDREAQFYSLATPAGTVSHTGAAGLTLGGGFGRLARKLGLACDNLIGADLVPADGKFVRASERENAELLWGLRGGGGNFGVVTSFEYRLHPVQPDMYGGALIYPFADAKPVLDFFAGYIAEAPDDLYADAVLATIPQMGKALIFDICYSGPVGKAERVLEPLRQIRKPAVDMLGPSTYVALQASGDERSGPGRAHYEKSGNIQRIEPGLIDTALSCIETSPAPGLTVIIVHNGGAIARVKPTATAFWNRGAGHSAIVHASWDDPRDRATADLHRAAARDTWRKLEPFTKGFYVNTIAADDPQDRVRSTYGDNYPRLVKLKDQYDPTNLFRRNANVLPSRASSA